MANELNLVGGEHVAPNASPAAQKFILLARGLLYSDDLEDALKQAITGGQYLSDGGVPMLSHIIQQLESQVGELSDVDLHAVAVHLAGSFVDLAAKMGDPDAQDKRAAVDDIVEGIMAVLSGQVDLGAMGGGQAGAPQGPPMGGDIPQGPAPLLASANG